MKTLLLSMLLSLSALAQQNPTPPPIAEQHRWLYDILFTEVDRQNTPSESFKSFYVHMFDSYLEFTHPENVASRNLKHVERVEGQLGYVNNVIKKRYAYDVYKTEDQTYVMNVRIYLKDPVGADFENFQAKLKQAEAIWNNSRIQLDFKFAFHFELVTEIQQAHYAVNVFDQTRGPYDQNWGRNWSATTIAHELGHMLGLGDEYQTLSGKVDCLKHSLMCTSSSGKLMEHHYYFVLRRLINSVVR